MLYSAIIVYKNGQLNHLGRFQGKRTEIIDKLWARLDDTVIARIDRLIVERV